jgi:hypothetical protein
MNIKYYARPDGGHIHSNITCPMLDGTQFKEYGYKEINLHEAERRNLIPCTCVYKDLGTKNTRLTIELLKEFEIY